MGRGAKFIWPRGQIWPAGHSLHTSAVQYSVHMRSMSGSTVTMQFMLHVRSLRCERYSPTGAAGDERIGRTKHLRVPKKSHLFIQKRRQATRQRSSAPQNSQTLWFENSECHSEVNSIRLYLYSCREYESMQSVAYSTVDYRAHTGTLIHSHSANANNTENKKSFADRQQRLRVARVPQL